LYLFESSFSMDKKTKKGKKELLFFKLTKMIFTA